MSPANVLVSSVESSWSRIISLKPWMPTSAMIRDQELSTEETKTFAGDINKDAQRLNRMITEMLELDRIEAGRMILNIVPVDLNAIVTDAAERARATSPNHTNATRLEPGLPAARGDSPPAFPVTPH